MKPPSQHAMTERAIAVQYLRQIAQKNRRLARRILNRGAEASPMELHTAATATSTASVLYQAAADLEHARHREGKTTPTFSVKAPPSTKKK